MLPINTLIGTHDIVFITLDTLRYDVAQKTLRRGETPHLAQFLPSTGWEARHSPGSFTYAAHHAFFAGFLPTPARPGHHARLFAAQFTGSKTTTDDTFVFDASDVVHGLSDLGYHTICIGGVAFFNKQSPLSCVLPDLFAESHWEPRLGVTEPQSTAYQVALACSRLTDLPVQQRIFLFLNVSAIHQPNYFYLPNSSPTHRDTIQSHAAALTYVDQHLALLFDTIRHRAPTLVIICSDHGTAYGDNGYTGHRLAHPVVWTVPYAEFIVDQSQEKIL